MTRPAADAIIRHRDRDFLALAGGDVENVQLAVLFINDAALAVGTWPADIPGLLESDLCGFPGREVVGIQIEMSVAVRIKEDFVTDPHRIAAGAFGVGNLLCLVALKIKNVELVRLAA